MSLRSRPKVASFLPLLKSIDSMNQSAAGVEIDMAMVFRFPSFTINRFNAGSECSLEDAKP